MSMLSTPPWRAVLGSLLLLPALAAAAPTQSCAGCHAEDVHAAAFAASVHQDLACTACHEPAVGATPAPGCTTGFAAMDCARCHERQAEEHAASVHSGDRLPVDCWQCHQDIHALSSVKEDRLATARLCAGCHEHQEDFFASVHGKSLEEGNADAPGCVDCHGKHSVQAVDNDGAGRDFHTTACMGCHADSTRMARSQVTLVAAETFLHSFHGKNVRLGHAETVAGCADCHGSHGVWPKDDVRSTVHEANKVETCRQCHAGATASFVRYLPHADDKNHADSPALYWTRVSMTALLVGTFIFFWAHSLLWAFRSFVERERATAAHAAVPATTGRTYRRFRRKHILLHLVVVISFLTLSLTGLPLKFAGTGWGQALADFFGGPDRARLLHHAAALVTFGWFMVAIVGSVRFLWTGRGAPGGMTARLLGPDSLFPSLRDWRDFTAMVKWFTFRGAKPRFERWTYWEKFDFLAVFWGMFAIGGSGLLLWFPELFARVLPGWIFNVATIIHSDEALLATGFIFTVHFFNTHFRPEKFPMDTVIFNGRISQEEMLEERADQYRRYEAEGRLDEFVEERPKRILWEFSSRIFGLVAVALGLGLALLMIFTLVGGGH